MIIVICWLMEKEFIKFETDNKIGNLPTHFCLVSISNGFSATESRGIFLKENVYNFSVNYNTPHKFHTLNIHKYLLVQNNKKMISWLIKQKFIVLLFVVTFKLAMLILVTM